MTNLSFKSDNVQVVAEGTLATDTESKLFSELLLNQYNQDYTPQASIVLLSKNASDVDVIKYGFSTIADFNRGHNLPNSNLVVIENNNLIQNLQLISNSGGDVYFTIIRYGN